MAERTISLPLSSDLPSPAVNALLATVIPDLIITAWHDKAAEHDDTGIYLKALDREQSLRYPYLDDPNAVAVVNDTPQAYWLEYGRAGFHLAARWKKWTQGKNGPYARVKFRVRTPGSKGGGMSTSRARFTMPATVQAMAQALVQGQRLKGMGMQGVKSKSYTHGITSPHIWKSLPPTLAGITGYTWKSSPFEGMMQAGMKDTPGGGTQSEYTTIRTITPDSPGWYIPPTPAYHFSEEALRAALPEITRLLEEAGAQDAMDAVTDAVQELT
jgi:hypothetical protein